MEDLKDWEIATRGTRWNGYPIVLAYGVLVHMKNNKTNKFKYWDVKDNKFLTEEEEMKVIGKI